VPVTPDNPAREANRNAWKALERWGKPFICCWSDGDPITRGLDRAFRERVPGARGQPHPTLHGGHFMQEDDARRSCSSSSTRVEQDRPPRNRAATRTIAQPRRAAHDHDIGRRLEQRLGANPYECR
jgi:hypothetical protein